MASVRRHELNVAVNMVATPLRRRAWFSPPEKDPRALALQAHNMLTKDRVGEDGERLSYLLALPEPPPRRPMVVNEIHPVSNPLHSAASSQPNLGQAVTSGEFASKVSNW